MDPKEVDEDVLHMNAVWLKHGLNHEITYCYVALTFFFSYCCPRGMTRRKIR